MSAGRNDQERDESPAPTTHVRNIGSSPHTPTSETLLKAIERFDHVLTEREKACHDESCRKALDNLNDDLFRLILAVYLRTDRANPIVPELRKHLIKAAAAHVTPGELVELARFDVRRVDPAALVQVIKELDTKQADVLFWSQQISQPSMLEAWQTASHDPMLESLIPKTVAQSLVAPVPNEAAVLKAVNAADADERARLKNCTFLDDPSCKAPRCLNA